MKLLFLILLFGITINLAAQDDRWVQYGTNKQGDDFFYDKETIEHNTSSTNVWIKIVFKSYLYDENTKDYETKNLIHLEIFCSERKYLNKEFIIYYDDGTNSYYDRTNEQEFNTIIPDSIIESLYNIICQ